MATGIKICGLKDVASLEAAIAAGADYAGLMFYGPSPRNVTLEQAAALAETARGRIRIVAVTVDADDDLLTAIARDVRPDYIQAHGSETPEHVALIAQRLGVAVIKVVKVHDAGDIASASAYDNAAAMMLFDAKPPRDKAGMLPGGNAVSFDWRLLQSWPREKPYMLAGGLDAACVSDAIKITGAPIVDVSSGVESAPGEKDANLIRQFAEAVRSQGHGI